MVFYLLVVILVCVNIYFFLKSKKIQSEQIEHIRKDENNMMYLNKNMLLKYNGVTKPQIFIAIKNIIFDVSSSEAYQKGGNYEMLGGHDCSINLAKMEMQKCLLDRYNHIKLNEEEQKTLDEWVEYFKKKEYPMVGYLVGA